MPVREVDTPKSDDPFITERLQGSRDRVFAVELKLWDIVPQIGPRELPVYRVGIQELDKGVLLRGFQDRLTATTAFSRG